MSETPVVYDVKNTMIPVKGYDKFTVNELVELQLQWLTENEDFAKKLFLLPGHIPNGKIEVGGRVIHFHEQEWVYVFGWTLPRWDQSHWRNTGAGWVQEEYLAVSIGNWFEDPKNSKLVAFRAWNTLYSKQLPGHQFFVPGDWMNVIQPSIAETISIMAKSAEKATREKRQELIDMLHLMESV